jgi:hypothetical protein
MLLTGVLVEKGVARALGVVLNNFLGTGAGPGGDKLAAGSGGMDT